MSQYTNIEIICNPDIVKSCVNFFYYHPQCIIDDFKFFESFFVMTSDNRIPIFLCDQMVDFFYLQIDEKKNFFYYANPIWTPTNEEICELLIEKCKMYKEAHHIYGIWKDQQIELIYCSDKNKKYLPINEHYRHILEINHIDKEKKGLILWKSVHKYHFDAYYENNTKIGNFNNIFIPTKENGIICLNSSLMSDMVVNFMKINDPNHIQFILEILTNTNDKQPNFLCSDNQENNFKHILTMTPFLTILNNLETEINRIKNSSPKHTFSKIHALLITDNKDFYLSKILIFQQNVSAIINLYISISNFSINNINKHLCDFIINFRKEFSIELCIIYHYLRVYPQERVRIYGKNANNSYIKLIKLIHRYYIQYKKSNKKSVEIDDIIDIFTTNVMDKYCNITQLIKDAVSQRSYIILQLYESFVNVTNNKIKPKYHTNNNYYPFKIFSPYLFIMEHILDATDL